MLNEGGGTRTHDLGIKSPLLYQLSYAPNARRNPEPEIFQPTRPAATFAPAEQSLISAEGRAGYASSRSGGYRNMSACPWSALSTSRLSNRRTS
jgi:hypothetical protein